MYSIVFEDNGFEMLPYFSNIFHQVSNSLQQLKFIILYKQVCLGVTDAIRIEKQILNKCE